MEIPRISQVWSFNHKGLQILKEGKTEKMHVHGFLPHVQSMSRIPTFLKSSDILVLTNYLETSVIEAAF